MAYNLVATFHQKNFQPLPDITCYINYLASRTTVGLESSDFESRVSARITKRNRCMYGAPRFNGVYPSISWNKVSTSNIRRLDPPAIAIYLSAIFKKKIV